MDNNNPIIMKPNSPVGIVGYAHIGREIARCCKAFGMSVMAVSRTVRDEGGLVDWYGTVAELDKLVSESDFIVVCAPIDDTTRGMIGTEQFAKMKPRSLFINASRGMVVDDVALRDCLLSGHIAGAVNYNVEGPDFEAQVGTLDPTATYAVIAVTVVISAVAAAACSLAEHLCSAAAQPTYVRACWGLPTVLESLLRTTSSPSRRGRLRDDRPHQGRDAAAAASARAAFGG